MLIFVFHLAFFAFASMGFFLLCAANSGGVGLDSEWCCVMEWCVGLWTDNAFLLFPGNLQSYPDPELDPDPAD